jgi:site-specific DNA recombinase
MTSENGARRAAIYARISNDPGGKALGVHDQAKQSRALAAGRGWDVTGPGCDCRDCARFRVPADVYCDNDITASGKRKRPHYERLLDDIKSGRVDVVVAVHTDRLHRNLAELERYIDICELREVETHTVKAGDLDLTASSGRAMARMMGVFARHELERMMERQKAAKRRNRDAGLRQSGTRPFGFTLDHNAATGLVPLPAEASAIRAACDQVLAGVSLTTIARQWNAAGLRTPVRELRMNPGDLQQEGWTGGKAWTSIGVRRVLLRAQNAGLVELAGREGRNGYGQIIGPARWEAIVSEDTWRAVRAVLVDKGRRTSPGPRPRWLLTGVLICGVCGCRRFSVVTDGRSPKYRCASKLADPLNPASGFHLSRDAAMLDEYVEWVIIEQLRDPKVVAALNTRPAVDIPALDLRRTAINAELEAWAGAPGITPRQLQIKNGPLLAELADVERQISEGLRGDPLPEFAGNDPVKVWAALKDAGNIERMRAVAATLLRVKVLPTGRTGRPPRGWRVGDTWPLAYDSVKILPPDA